MQKADYKRRLEDAKKEFQWMDSYYARHGYLPKGTDKSSYDGVYGLGDTDEVRKAPSLVAGEKKGGFGVGKWLIIAGIGFVVLSMIIKYEDRS